MLALTLVALVSILVPLSLCVVPSFARWTVFPVLNKLIHRYTATYVRPSLHVEYEIGSFPIRQRPLDHGATSSRGVTLKLEQIELLTSFLETLAFDHKGTAPVVLRACSIGRIHLRLVSTWRVVIEIERVDVQAQLLDFHESDKEQLLEIKDAIAMKVAEAVGLLAPLVAQRAKDEQTTQLAHMREIDKAFSFKDRVMQLVMAQMDVHVRNVEIAVDAPVRTDLPPSLEKDHPRTRLTIGVDHMDVLSDIVPETASDEVGTFERVQTSSDARVSHKIRFQETKIVAGTTRKDSNDVLLLGVPVMELNLNVPPMARVMGLVPNFHPIPLEKRQCRVELVLPANTRVTVARETIIRVLGELYVPYADYQVAVQTLRRLEVELASAQPANDEDVTFYVDNVARVETDSKLAPAEKEKINDKLRTIEARLSLNEIVRYRTKSLGLGQHLRGQDELTVDECVVLAQELAQQPQNVQFVSTSVDLRLESFGFEFVEEHRHVAEMLLHDVVIAMEIFALGKQEASDAVLTRSIDLTIEQTIFSIMPSPIPSSRSSIVALPTVGPSESPASKLLFADFSQVAKSTDVGAALQRLQQMSATVRQYQSGKQAIVTAMRGLQIVCAAPELEYFLMFVDRLTTEMASVMATARPAPPLVSRTEPTATAAEGGENTLAIGSPRAQEPNMTPFAKLGGMAIELDARLEGCRLTLLPLQSFADAIFTDADIKEGRKSQIEIPLDLRVVVSGSSIHEKVELDMTKIGIIARYLETAGSIEEDVEHILAPAAFALTYVLAVDPSDPLLCRQDVGIQMPDVVFALSDLSLALLSSCTQALSSIQTTTPEHAQLRLESQLKQEELRKQAEIDAVLDRIRRMFDEIDDDRNGRIELGELLLLLRRAKVADSLLECELEYFVRVLFKEIDRDGNGFIEFDELREYLRDDVLGSSGGVEGFTAAGGAELEGFLNLRGGEYQSMDVVERLSGTKPRSGDQLREMVGTSHFQGRFWDLYASEMRGVRGTLNGRHPLEMQKQLVRLMGHYEAAELVWSLILMPDLDDIEKCDWLLQPSAHCGGVCDYQSAAKVLTQQKKDSIFAIALQEFEEKVLLAPTSAVKKQLVIATDLKLGNLRVILTDPELPVQFSRGEFSIQNVKLSVDLRSKEIDVLGGVDWVAMATSGHSEWTALFGLRVIATAYSDLANKMEHVIEPWEIAAGLSSSEGENGFSVLLEAEKRFQINVTHSFLKMYRALNDVIAGQAQRSSWKKHQEAYRSGLLASSRQGTECLVQNLTGCPLVIQVSGTNERIEVPDNGRVYTKVAPASGSNKVELQILDIAGWGHSDGVTSLPAFGAQNVRLRSSASTPATTLFVTAYCRLEDPLRQRLVFKSNLYVCNHSSQDYEVKYLALGSEERKSFTSEVIKLRPTERMTLPVSLLMGITEVYARPAGLRDWIIKANVNNDLLTSPAAIQELEEYERAMQTKRLQRRGGSIVYGETQENASKIIKQLSASILMRRWHFRTHFEWEFSLLPPFVIRNSLPYMAEYRFLEYKVKSTKNAAAEFVTVEATLRADDDQLDASVFSGRVESGKDAEIAGISCFSPGYLSVRLVSRKSTATKQVTPWSKPLLMAIHGTVDQFTTARERIELAKGVTFSLDRLTNAHHPRLVRLSCPYWVVNNSSIDVALASAAPGAKASSLAAMEVVKGFDSPRMVYLEHDRLSIKPLGMDGVRPRAWTTLSKVPEWAYTTNPLTQEALKTATWSEPMNSTTVNTVGECASGPTVFGVKIEGLYGAFEQSIALTVSPRFYVQNRLRETVYVQTFASTEGAEQSDQQFRKRSAEDAKTMQFAMQTGETVPLYHFAPLKKGETLNNCQKYMSMSFGQRWAEGSWSHAIPVSTAGDTYLQLYSPLKKRSIICQASVQVIDMYVYVILSDASGSPPYRIENYTPFRIDCSQLGEPSSLFRAAEKESRHIVKQGEWYAFAWHNSLAKEHKMEVRLVHPDGRAKDKQYNVDVVGYHEAVVLDRSKDSDGNARDRVEVVVQTIVDEGTRVLKFMEKELEMSRLENQDAQFEREFEQRKMIFASSFDVRLAGFGMSLFDALPQEIFFTSVDVIQVQKPPSSLQWTFSVFHSQVDNMLPTAKFPVVLNPVNAGYSDMTIGKPPKPLVKLVMDADLAAKIGIYKLLEFQLSNLALKADLDYLVNLAKLVEPYLASDASAQSASIQIRDRVLKRQVPAMPITQLTADGNIRRDMVYFDTLRIYAFSVDLEYSITRKDIVSSAGGSNSIFFGWITQIVGLIGSNLSGSPTLSFSEIVIARCFSTKERLQSQLIQNFIRQVVLQAYRLVGSVDIIGDPIGLVEDLGSGVIEFLKITKDEVLGDSQTRGEGVKVLGKTVMRSGASTLAKITGSLDKFVGEFADDEGEENKPVQPGTEKSNDTAVTGLAPIDGGLKFAKDFGKGITGIFTKPVEGAMKGGVAGLVQGTVQGIAGPGVVLLKQITSTSHNIALGVQSTVVDRSPFGGRRRQPKKIDDNAVVADFDERHYRPTRLFVEVISAQGLLSDSSCDPLCVVRIDEKAILKTRVLYNTLNPVWQEKTQVELTGSEHEVQVVVKDSYGGAIDKTIGKCVLPMEQLMEDFRPPEFSSNLAQWVKTGIRPEETKKNVSHQIKEKEYILLIANREKSSGMLLGLGSSSKTLRATEKDLQVVVTIEALRELKVTSSSGGGVLGLGNLVSSTPNISPYVSIHVGKTAHRTNTAKMKFAGQKGSAEWHEAFSFPLTRTDADGGRPQVLLSLKDKSMLHDETLGYAHCVIPLSESVIVEDLPLRTGKNDLGEMVGHVKVKVEVVGATASATPKAQVQRTPSDPSETSWSVDSPMARTASASVSAASLVDGVKAGKIRIACEFV